MTIVRNKANFPAVPATLGFLPRPSGLSASNHAKRTQIPPAGPIVRNEANLHRSGRPDTPSFQDSNRRPKPDRQIVQNEANSGPCSVGRGLGDENRGGQLRETKPISRLRIGDCGLETDLPRPAHAGQTCKTKPICPAGPGGTRHGGRGANVQNEANFLIADFGLRIGDGPAARRRTCGLRRAKCAKQTQFPAAALPHHPTTPLFHHSNPMPMVRNEANFLRHRVGRGPGDGGVGRCTNKANLLIGTGTGVQNEAGLPIRTKMGVRNKANLRPSGPREGSGIRHRTAGRGDRYNWLAVSRGCR